MPNLTPRNLQQIRAQNPQLGDCLFDIVNAHNNVGQQTNSAPVGSIPAPTGHSALNVTGGAGFFSAQITSNAPAFRGTENFLEVSEDPNFSAGNVHTIHLGASQSYYGYLGPKKLHFRSYPALPTSPPATPIYALNVDGTGAMAPPIAGNGSAAGWGKQPYTTPTVPIR